MRATALLAVLTSLLASVPAQAQQAAADPLSYEPRAARVDAIRDATATRSVARALAAATGSEPLHDPAPWVPEISALAHLSPALAAGIAAVVSAHLAAQDVVARAIPSPVRARIERYFAGVAAGSYRLRTSDREGRRSVSRRVSSLADDIDREAIVASSLRIAGAIDHLVMLADAGILPAPSAGVASSECDVAQVDVVLCVGGSGANVYRTDFIVTIDLGGSDTYFNSAGGAYLCGQSVIYAEVYPCARSVVDLAGDDRYEPHELGTLLSFNCSVNPCQQGSGIAAIGMLVDRAGDDSYSSFLNAKEGIILQSQAVGILGGVGVLADLAGNDTYRNEIDASAGLIWPTEQYAQGVALFGAAMLWDRSGDETYEIVGPSTGRLAPLSLLWDASLAGQGMAICSPGWLIDGGGRDTFSAIARPQSSDAAGASFDGQGYGQMNCSPAGVGVGGLVEGDGDTTYSADLVADFYSSVFAQGDGSDAVLDDRSGHDSYIIRSVTAGEIGTNCRCALAAVDLVSTSAGGAFPGANYLDRIAGYASGQGSGGGLLHDATGHDSYFMSVHKTVDVVAVNERPGAPARARALRVGTVLARGQSQSSRFELVDEEGNDRYDVEIAHRLTVRAQGTSGPEGEPVLEARAFPKYGGAQVQNAINDLGGHDSYSLTSDLEGIAFPDPGGHADGGGFYNQPVATPSQMELTDIDSGEADRFHGEIPTIFSTCDGRYGVAPGWTYGVPMQPQSEVPATACTGTSRVTATSTEAIGDDTLIEITSITPPDAGKPPLSRVAVRLTDSAGVPIQGARILVTGDQMLSETAGFESWWDLGTSSDLRTGADGIATGLLRVGSCYTDAPCVMGVPIRVRAMFFGDLDHAAVHVVSPRLRMDQQE